MRTEKAKRIYCDEMIVFESGCCICFRKRKQKNKLIHAIKRAIENEMKKDFNIFQSLFTGFFLGLLFILALFV